MRKASSPGFIGRRRELELLERAFRSDPSAFIPIYGRRRVGKSELILRFCGGKPAVYFVGKQAPASLQIQEFLRSAALAVRDPLLGRLAPSSWREALEIVVDRWTRPGKLVLVLDEFQWTAGASPELPSVLQECWDRKWRDSGKVLLILCGSYVGFMEREVLGKRSPLFGRRTAQILLRPFGYREAALFHPSYSLVDQARVYLVCGGVPQYLRQFDSKRSVEMNIAALLLDELGPLFREPDFLLREELRELESYNAVLLAMATGSLTNKEISQRTGIGERSLHYYLQQLVELGYVLRRHPLTGGAAVARHVRFHVGDPLLRFWFRFIYPNLSALAQLGPEKAFAALVRPELQSYLGVGFEALCREALPDLYAQEGVSGSFQIGEYWDKHMQIDVVGLRDDRWVDVGECRWGTMRTWSQVVRELEAKVMRYPGARDRTVALRMFTSAASRGRPVTGYQIYWHSLAQLYGAE